MMRLPIVALCVMLSGVTDEGTTFSRASNGPVLTLANGTRPTFEEYGREGYAERGSVGALGGFEMNVSYNMDYADNTHKLYDTSKPGLWSAWGPLGYTLQWCAAGSNSQDCWQNRGVSLFHAGKEGAQFTSNNSAVPYRTWVNNSTSSTGGATAWQRSGNDIGYVGDARALSSSYSADDFSIWAVNTLIVKGQTVSLEGEVTVNGQDLMRLLSSYESRLRALEAQVR